MIKRIETIQRAENGGMPAANGGCFIHGDEVYIVEKNGFDLILDIAVTFAKCSKGARTELIRALSGEESMENYVPRRREKLAEILAELEQAEALEP